MTEPGEYGYAFKRILRKLEEEHSREISQCREEYRRELSALKSQLAPEQGSALKAQLPPEQGSALKMKLAPEQGRRGVSFAPESLPSSSNGMSPAQSMEGDRLTVHDGADTHPDASDSRKRSDNRNAMFRRGSSFISDHGTMLQDDSTVLRSLVSGKMGKMGKESDKFTSMMEKYALSRGWNVQPARVELTRLQKVVAHKAFDFVSAVAILLNTALLGAITSMEASTLGAEEVPVQYRAASLVFSTWFLIELTMRWASEGCLGFVCASPNLSWNVFDIFVVGTDIFEQMLDLTARGEDKMVGSLILMRMLRVLRIARALRVIRLLKFCADLRVMILSVLKSGMSIFWSMILLGIICYIFGSFLMQSVTEYLAERATDTQRLAQAPRFPPHSTEGKLEKYFGTLSMTFYVLFQTVSGGISWCEVSDPLLEIHAINAFVFCLFVFFTVFAMLNIITGFFVESAFCSVQKDDEEVIQEELRSENSLMRQLHSIFLEFDPEGRGWITEEQFGILVSDKRAHALMLGLGLQVNEAKGLHAMLAVEETGTVSVDDFIVGCMRLRGGAQEVDLLNLMYENRKMHALFHRLDQCVKKEFERLDKFEDRVDEILARLPAFVEQESQILRRSI